MLEKLEKDREMDQEEKTKLEEKLLTYQGDLNDRKSKAEVAKAELDLANSNYEKEKEVFDGMLVTYEQAAKGIETQTR